MPLHRAVIAILLVLLVALPAAAQQESQPAQADLSGGAAQRPVADDKTHKGASQDPKPLADAGHPRGGGRRESLPGGFVAPSVAPQTSTTGDSRHQPAVFRVSLKKQQEEPAWLSVMAFRDSMPASALGVRLDGKSVGRLDRLGYFEIRVAPGEHTVAIYGEEGEGEEGEILRRRLQAEAGDDIRLTVNLTEDGEASVEVTAAGGSGELLTETAAEPGRIAGRVVDSEDKTPIVDARVLVRGTSAEARTDEDGAFELELPSGEHTLSVIHGDYATRSLAGVSVPAENTAELGKVELTPAGLDLGEFVVTAPYVEGSVASVISEQRQARGVSEVLGADQMSAAGDSDAADALARVTGLTIEDGKYVVIRGQPARYTKTLLNGSPLPSPDPIKRIVPLDLFPTGILSRIRVEKSYQASRPGSFGAGLVDLETADVPDANFLELSVGTGFNSVSTGETGLDHGAAGSDFLASDDGSRDVPAGVSGAEDLEAAAQSFSNDWEPQQTTLGPDQSLGLNAGFAAQLWGADLGVRTGFDWSRAARLTETIERDYALSGDDELVLRNDQTRERHDVDIDLGMTLLAGLDWGDHAVRSNTFLLRKATRRTETTEGVRAVSNDYYIRDTLLEWTERELLIQQLLGDHELGPLQVDWRAMLAESRWEQPDRRDYRYRRNLALGDDAEMIFDQQNGARRRYSQSDDSITGLGLDLALPVLEAETVGLELQGGISVYDQERESHVERYRFEPKPEVELDQPPEAILDPDNVGDSLKVRDDTQDNDNYYGTAAVTGSYLGMTFDWTEALTVNAGMRREQADFEVRTFKAGGSSGPQEVAGAFEKSTALPSLSATWRFTEHMQLRSSWGRSVSRPMLNELTPGRYVDPDSGDEFLGNPDLEPAEIESLDARWEWYPGSRDLIALGAFTKEYTDPLEESFVAVGGSSYLRRIQNASGATVEGVEAIGLTSLKSLVGWLGWQESWLEDLYLQANATFIESSVELASQDLASSADRPLQGQADVVYNLQLGYEGERNQLNLALNRVGERLMIAGVQGQPDVYQEPVTYLDFSWRYSFTDRWEIKFSAGNLLDTETTLLQGGEVYRQSQDGRDYGLSFTYRLE